MFFESDNKNQQIGILEAIQKITHKYQDRIYPIALISKKIKISSTSKNMRNNICWCFKN